MLARDARGRMQRPTAEADNSPEPEAPDEADVGRDVGCGFLPAGPRRYRGRSRGPDPVHRRDPASEPQGSPVGEAV